MDFQKVLTEQESFKAKHGRHFQIVNGGKKHPREKETISTKDIPANVEIHEHLCPNRDVGFTVFEKKTENGKNYFKATGSGCGSQTFDWQEFKPLN